MFGCVSEDNSQPPSAHHMYGMNGGWRTLEGVSVYSDEGGGVASFVPLIWDLRQEST